LINSGEKIWRCRNLPFFPTRKNYFFVQFGKGFAWGGFKKKGIFPKPSQTLSVWFFFPGFPQTSEGKKEKNGSFSGKTISPGNPKKFPHPPWGLSGSGGGAGGPAPAFDFSQISNPKQN